MSSLHQIPVEVRKKIFDLCTKRDLVNIAVCSRFWCKEVVPILWCEVTVNWREGVEENVDNKTINMRHARALTFSSGKQQTGYKSFAFAFLVRNCDPVRLISLRVVSCIVPDGLQLVAEKLPNLQNLDLRGLIEAKLDPLTQFQLLQSLSLNRCEVTDHQVKTICELKNLRVLELRDLPSRVKVTSQSLEYISRLTELKELVFRMGDRIADKDSLNRTIPKLRNLVRLEIPRSNVDAGLFKDMERQVLEILNISHSNLSGLILPLIFKFHNLKKLNLSDCDEFSDEGFETIHQLHHLVYLSLSCSKISDKGARCVSKLATLRFLSLFGCSLLTDGALQFISQLKLLDMLNIGFNSNYTDTGISYLTSLHNLQNLLMSGLNITGEGLHSVSKLRNLRRLDISACPELTDDGLLPLSSHPCLTEVDCYDCQKLTEEGMTQSGIFSFYPTE